MKLRLLSSLLFACILSPALLTAQQSVVLKAEETAKILPPAVFFKGLSAPVQGRNSGGVRFADKSLMLVSLVDTSGYSTQLQAKYQAYLIVEETLDIGGHKLVPGAYGCGFIANDTFIVQDLGAHDLFTAHSTNDAGMRRPTPLQVQAVPGQDGNYRLYAGRNYIAFKLAGH
jgi:hypothetical protein